MVDARPRRPWRGFTPAVLGLTAALVYGTAGYMVVERYDLLDEVRPLDAAGQVFTITLIAFGVLDFLYILGVIVEQLASGRWREWRRYQRVERDLAALRDHVIVCGYGRAGTQIGRELERGGHAFVVVEMNPDGMENVERDQRLCVQGDAATDAVLQRAGIERARALISAVDSDERNVYIVLTARSVNPGLFIVARSSYPDSVSKLQRAGADRVVSPYTEGGQRMAALAVQPALVDVIDTVLGDGSPVTIEELLVPADVGSTTAGDLRTSGVTLLAVRSHGVLTVGPDDDAPVGPGDLLIAVGDRDQLAALATTLSPIRPRSGA